MYTLNLQQTLLLFFAAVLGGAVNAVAGGGTLLTFPAILCAGQLARVGQRHQHGGPLAGAASSFWGYRSEMGSSRREIAMLSIPSFLGGIAGAVLLVSTSNESFARVVPFLILLATTLFIVQEPLGRWLRRRAAESAADGLPQQGDVAYGTRDEWHKFVVPALTGSRQQHRLKAGLQTAHFRPRAVQRRPSSRRGPAGQACWRIQFAVGVYGGYFGRASASSCWRPSDCWA